ncbi:MAG TPA: hypothetical protein VNQ77_14185 [Frankiaceae bacterium]|nr:hypothetical protein [Frankiaceae bacterium]
MTTYSVEYGHWTTLQVSGAVVASVWMAWLAWQVTPVLALLAFVVLGVVWWVVLRMLVTRIHLVGRMLLVHTPLRTVQLSADEVSMRVPALRLSYAYLRGPQQMRGFQLPNIEGTRELARLIREG